MSDTSPLLGQYLRSGPDQARLLRSMAEGHALTKHGAELGQPSAASYHGLVKQHLATARLGFSVTGGDGRPRYLVADTATNRVAWIAPHRERRSTFFAPRQGVSSYIRYQRLAKAAERWQPLNLEVERMRAASRGRNVDRSPGASPSRRSRMGTAPLQPTRRIASTVRRTGARGPAR